MESKSIPCPYCGCIIENDVESCPQCHEIFKEMSLPIQINSLGRFIAFNCVTFGLFQYIWLLLNIKKINNMALSKKDKLKFDIPFYMLIVSILFFMVVFSVYYIWGLSAMLPLYLILLFAALFMVSIYIVTYRILRIIEKYTYHKYEVRIYHSELGWLFCPIFFTFISSPLFYTIYFIYTYKERVYNPKPIRI